MSDDDRSPISIPLPLVVAVSVVAEGSPPPPSILGGQDDDDDCIMIDRSLVVVGVLLDVNNQQQSERASCKRWAGCLPLLPMRLLLLDCLPACLTPSPVCWRGCPQPGSLLPPSFPVSCTQDTPWTDQARQGAKQQGRRCVRACASQSVAKSSSFSQSPSVSPSVRPCMRSPPCPGYCRSIHPSIHFPSFLSCLPSLQQQLLCCCSISLPLPPPRL